MKAQPLKDFHFVTHFQTSAKKCLQSNENFMAGPLSFLWNFYFIVDMLRTPFVYFTRNMMPFYFSITSTLDTLTLGLLWKKKLINSRHPNIRFTMDREAYHKLSFLDDPVNNNDPNSRLTSVYRSKTFTDLLNNYFSFTSYSYKVGLIRTLVSRAYKINNTWLGLHEDITKLMHNP